VLPLLYLLHGANSSPAEIMERSELVNLAKACCETPIFNLAVESR
jgi:hypothetical protein